MSDSLLILDHVSKFYGTVIGVGDLNIDLPRGAYGLIGPNGAGKTTLLNLLTGILRPSLGHVHVLGCDPYRQRKVLKQIGLCPASDILFPNISALNWVAYQTGLHGFSQAESRTRAMKSLQLLGMEAAMDRPIGSFSLGMRQRTKLAQAIAHDPEFLILDEPFNGLDPIGRHELSDFLGTWIDRGRSLLLASHVLHEVEAVTRSFLLIHGGRILASGNASEVRSMLSGFPAEVELGGVGLRKVAQVLVQQEWLQGLSFSEGYSKLQVQVSDRDKFGQLLTELAGREDREVEITSLRSPDSSLEGAFALLLKAHRGEYNVQPG